MPITSTQIISVIPPKTSGGSLKNAANIISSHTAKQGEMADLWAAVTKALRDAQSQMDGFAHALASPIALPDPIQVLDSTGVLVAEIGMILDPTNVHYAGIWAKSIWIGGSGPSDAQIAGPGDGTLTLSGKIRGTLTMANATDTGIAVLNAPATVGGTLSLSNKNGSVVTIVDANQSPGPDGRIRLFQNGVGGSAPVIISAGSGIGTMQLQNNTDFGGILLQAQSGTPGAYLQLQGAAAATTAFLIQAGNGSKTSATAGTHGAVPAQVAGYYQVIVDGANQKIPYFNV
jgi:hypothetical protein